MFIVSKEELKKPKNRRSCQILESILHTACLQREEGQNPMHKDSRKNEWSALNIQLGDDLWDFQKVKVCVNQISLLKNYLGEIRGPTNCL